MDWQFTLLLMAGLIVALVLTGLPVAVVLLSVSLGFLVASVGMDRAVFLLGEELFDFWSGWALLPIPLFILMGEFLFVGGSAADIFDMASKWLRRLPGGLALVSTGASAVFASMCGSSAGATATMSVIAIPEMLKRGYSQRLATGAIAASGALAHLIPPSVLMVVYASIAEISPGRALMGAFLPGFMLAGYYMIITVVWALRRPGAAPAESPVPWKERLSSLRVAWQPIAIVLAVMGTMYAGIATATEAAAMGALIAIAMALARRKVNWKNLTHTLVASARMSAFIMFIAVAGKILSLAMTYYMIPQNLVRVMTDVPLPPPAMMVLIQVMYLFLGMFLDPIGMMVVTLPVVLPLLTTLGFDPYWFGVMLMINFEMALVTPPMGPQLYIIKGIFPDVPLSDILYGALIFMIAPVLMLATLLAFPQLALWLPSRMMGG